MTSLLAFVLACAAATAGAQDELPFVTTPDHMTLALLALAGVGPADSLIDLGGAGDARIAVTAAQRLGASGLGVVSHDRDLGGWRAGRTLRFTALAVPASVLEGRALRRC